MDGSREWNHNDYGAMHVSTLLCVAFFCRLMIGVDYVLISWPRFHVCECVCVCEVVRGMENSRFFLLSYLVQSRTVSTIGTRNSRINLRLIVTGITWCLCVYI